MYAFLRSRAKRLTTASLVVVLTGLGAAAFAVDPQDKAEPNPAPSSAAAAPGAITCANLIYGSNKTSVCYSPEFLAETARQTNIITQSAFTPVKVESDKLYRYPFAVWTGEGAFQLSSEQRHSLRQYLTGGGFIVASAGCSSPDWSSSFRTEMVRTFPEVKLTRIELGHPMFHTVYDVEKLDCKKSPKDAHLEGLEIDGRIVLVFSEDGLNDTAKAGKNCCCCGGNEIRNARQINVNLLAYALTH